MLSLKVLTFLFCITIGIMPTQNGRTEVNSERVPIALKATQCKCQTCYRLPFNTTLPISATLYVHQCAPPYFRSIFLRLKAVATKQLAAAPVPKSLFERPQVSERATSRRNLYLLLSLVSCPGTRSSHPGRSSGHLCKLA